MAEYPNRPVFVVDWDGTCVAEYREDGTAYWPEMGPWLPPDPVTGVTPQDALHELSRRGKTVIFTARLNTLAYNHVDYNTPEYMEEQTATVRRYLDEAALEHIDIYPAGYGKPCGEFYIDDKALTFRGNWTDVLALANLTKGSYA